MNKELAAKVKKYGILTTHTVNKNIDNSGSATSFVSDVHSFAAKHNIEFDDVCFECEVEKNYSDTYAGLTLSANIDKTEEELAREVADYEKMLERDNLREIERLKKLIKKNPGLKQLLKEE